MDKLTGTELINKLNNLPDSYKLTDKVDACGYYYKTNDGFHCDYDSFFKAVEKAKQQHS